MHLALPYVLGGRSNGGEGRGSPEPRGPVSKCSRAPSKAVPARLGAPGAQCAVVVAPRVGHGHPADEVPDLPRHRGPPWSPTRKTGPVIAEPAPLPGDDRGRVDEDQGIPPACPGPGEPCPQNGCATWGAELARGEGRSRIFVVEPTGPFEDDPNLTNKKFAGNPTRSYRSSALSASSASSRTGAGTHPSRSRQ